MIFIQHLNKIMFFVTIIEISKLQGSYGLSKREVFIEEL